ncbi:MAG: aldehyde dehydrogenase family protein [Planctomycetes bacterium]|nr:aldehyde dehydrogenase family protein [Planctomycetota bacterium]
MSGRIDVSKTYKLYVGGAFPRSESGRTYTPAGAPGVNVCRASRKDLRDAVVAARGAFGGWARRDAYNRGQILYRLAEMLETRKAALAAELVAGGSVADHAEALREVEATVDLCVWHAGLADKLNPLLGSQTDASGPFFVFSTVEPTGVIGVVAPERPALLGLCALLLPVLVSGNVAIALCSESSPLAGLALGEVCASSDVPAGVVALLSGHRAELLAELAKHRAIDGLLLAAGDAAADAEAARLAADSVKRVRRCTLSAAGYAEPAAVRRLDWVEPFVEVKTLWHPVSAR